MGKLIILCLFAAQSWADVTPFETPKRLDAEGFQDFYAQVAPNVWVAGQPSEAAIQQLSSRGVTTVINLRTSQEMDNRSVVPYDEAQALADAGIEYVHIPQGGPETPYSPEALQKVAAALEAAEGNVLLHCMVAWRASHMWAAYLVAHQGYSVADAVNVGKQMNMGGYPFAQFLHREVSLKDAGDE